MDMEHGIQPCMNDLSLRTGVLRLCGGLAWILYRFVHVYHAKEKALHVIFVSTCRRLFSLRADEAKRIIGTGVCVLCVTDALWLGQINRIEFHRKPE